MKTPAAQHVPAADTRKNRRQNPRTRRAPPLAAPLVVRDGDHATATITVTEAGIARARVLARLGHPVAAIAGVLGVSPSALRAARRRQAPLDEALEAGLGEQSTELVHTLLEAARKGQYAAAMFLLKCRHGYRETGATVSARRSLSDQPAAPMDEKAYARAVSAGTRVVEVTDADNSPDRLAVARAGRTRALQPRPAGRAWLGQDHWPLAHRPSPFRATRRAGAGAGPAGDVQIPRELVGRDGGVVHRRVSGGIQSNRADFVIRCPNGAVVTLGDHQSRKDVAKWQGQEANLLAVDEITNFATLRFINMLRANLRGPADVPTRMIVFGNPGGPLHATIARMHVHGDSPGSPTHWTTGARRVLCPSTYLDNPASTTRATPARSSHPPAATARCPRHGCTTIGTTLPARSLRTAGAIT